MGLWSMIKNAASFIGGAVKKFFSSVGNIISSVATTVATAVATFVPNPIVKTIATVAAVAIPAITIGANVIKEVKASKEYEPEALIDQMVVSYDEEEDYYSDDVNDFVQKQVDTQIYGKKEAKKLAKQRAAEKVEKIKNSSKSDEVNEFVTSGSANTNLDDILSVVTHDDDDDEVYVDEPPKTGNIHVQKGSRLNNLDEIVAN